METENFANTVKSTDFQSIKKSASPDDTNSRLNSLLAINAQTAREKSLYRCEEEEFEASLMRRPMSAEKSYAVFGLMLGTLPPAAIFSQVFSRPFNRNEAGLLVLLAFMNMICAAAGYGMGKVTGKMMSELERESFAKMIFLAPFIGVLWAMVTGFAGGALFLLIGGFFGAALAIPVAAAGFPLFALFRRLIKRGENIEFSRLLPIAFGVTAVIAALIFGS